jgi:hypothetical protein
MAIVARDGETVSVKIGSKCDGRVRVLPAYMQQLWLGIDDLHFTIKGRGSVTQPDQLDLVFDNVTF